MNTPEHTVFAKLPLLKPFRHEDAALLNESAKADGHVALAPTHVIWKEGQIVGCVSVASIPLIIPWMHTKLVGPRDSVNVLNATENLLYAAGHQVWAMPCMANSPYFKFMESFGYLNTGLTTLFFKKGQT